MDLSAATQQAARGSALNLLSLILQQQGACRHLEGLQQVTALLLVLPAMAVRNRIVLA